MRKFTAKDKTIELGKRTLIMGIVNVTPDSFSDGGETLQLEDAVERALKFDQLGVDFIDIGGESSRPFSEPVSEEEESERVLPIIERLKGEVKALISIDTYKASVAENALVSGADVVNDISGGSFDNNMIGIVKKYHAGVVLMHIKGTPKNMQVDPHYEDVVSEVKEYLHYSAQRFINAGVASERILVDPGIGFGKSLEHNLRLIKNLNTFQGIGAGVLVGPSRKQFIGTLTNTQVKERLDGTLGAISACSVFGADIIRVHDVLQVKRALQIVDAVKNIELN